MSQKEQAKMNEITSNFGDVKTTQAAGNPANDVIPISELLLTARRQLLPVAICVAVGLVAAVLHYATTPPKYYAAASVMIEERTSDLVEELTASLPMLRNDTAVLNEMQVIHSLHLAEVVAREIKLYDNDKWLYPKSSLAGSMVLKTKRFIRSFLPGRPDAPLTASDMTEEELFDLRVKNAALKLQNDVKVQRVGQSYLLEISTVSQDPALAASIVNTYASSYLQDQINANVEISTQRADWMREHLDQVRDAATTAARDAEQYRAENKAMDVQGLREREARADTLNRLYQSILSRYEQVAIEGSFPVANGRVLAESVVPKDAALPKLWQLMAIGLVLGLIVGLVIAVFREYRDQSFRTGSDVRSMTGLPFLGYLPVFRPGRLSRIKPISSPKYNYQSKAEFVSARSERIKAATQRIMQDKDHTAAKAMVGRTREKMYVPRLFVPALLPNDDYCETLKNIHASLELHLPLAPTKIMAFGSISQGEGASTVAANFANMLAQSGARTLLIDANTRSPGLSLALGCANEDGLVEVLGSHRGIDEVIKTLPYTGLEFLPCKYDRQNALASGQSYYQDLSELLAALKGLYDNIVIDIPPLGATADAKALLKSLDGMVLVSKWGQTSKAEFQQYLEYEPDVARKTAGVVLNATNFQKLARYGVRRGYRFAGRRFARS